MTARPSWSRVKTIITSYIEVAGVERVRLSLVGPAVSARYGDLSDIVPKDIETKSHPTLRESDDLASVTLSCLDGSQALVHQWSKSRPDCVLVVADRSETLGVSAAAALMQIPLNHLQGGETSGSIDHKIRDVNSKLADLHLTTNSETKNYLESLGEDPESIFIVGCPSIDLVSKVLSNPLPDLENLGGVGAKIDLDSKFGILMFHPDTLEPKETISWVRVLIEFIENSAIPWVWFWPNPDHGTNLTSKMIRTAREHCKLTNVLFVINLPPEEFIALASKAALMLGNSSFGIREASFIGIPTLNLGTRQTGRQRASNVTDINKPNLEELLINADLNLNKRFSNSRLYGDGTAGQISAQIISQWEPKIKRNQISKFTSAENSF